MSTKVLPTLFDITAYCAHYILPLFLLLLLSIPFPISLPCASAFRPALPPLIRSLSTEPHVSESIRAESRRGRSFTEVNIKLHQALWRNRSSEGEEEGVGGGREGALRP